MLERRPLRDQIVDEILASLAAGDYPINTRIDEMALVARLGVSRTPVREALTLLERQGVVESRLGKGFWVAPVTATDIRDTYPIVAALEVFALRSTDRDRLPALAQKLLEAAAEMGTVSGEPQAVHAADAAWHALLISGYGNARLAETVEGLKISIQRHELVVFSSPDTVAHSVEQHTQIADALARGDVARACRVLEKNWRDSMATLLDRLDGAPE